MSGQPNGYHTFDLDKAITVIGYFVQRTRESMYPLMKLMYLADKLHLERYGRFIVGDTYCALKQGPVPSNTYNMMKHLRGEDRQPGFVDAEAFFDYGNNHELTLRRDIDLDELSGSEIECLQIIAEVYGQLGKWGVRDLSHDTAWADAWSTTNRKKSVPIALESIAMQLEDGDVLLRHIGDRHPGEAPRPAVRKRLVKRQA